MWHDSCDMTHVTWLIRNMTQLFLTAQTRSSFCVTCRIYMWHDSCDITYVILHDSSVTWLSCSWLRKRAVCYVWHAVFICDMADSCEKESWHHTYEWVVLPIWMSRVTHMNESRHTNMSRVTHMNESCHTWMNEWFMSHILIKRTPLPPGGFPIYYVPSSGTRE